MNRRLFARFGSFSCAAVILLAHGWVWAAAEKPEAGEPPKVPTTLRPADADGDGKVTRAEWGGLMQRFSRIDANHDGAIDLAELQAEAKNSETPILLAAADTDGDGRLTRAEWKRLAQGFARLDANHDGSLELPELESVAMGAEQAIKVARAMPSLNGLWRGWIVEGRGENPNGGMMELELAITGNRIAGRELKPQAGDVRPDAASINATADLGVGTFVTTGNGRGGFFDAMYLNGPHAGQTCLGLYRLDDNTLYWCATNRSGQRPDIFSSGNGCYLMILHRVPMKSTTAATK